MNVRELAYLSLEKCDAAGRYSNIETDTVIKRSNMTDVDRAFYTNLVYGTIEKEISLDHVISQFSKVAVDKIEKKLLILLRLGVYQILYLDRIPDSAACNETVELCKKYSHKGAEKFINAILRSVVRNKDNLDFPDMEKNPQLYCSVKYGIPLWIIRMWEREYGRDRMLKISETFLERPNLCIRVNTLKITRDELINKLIAEGIQCEKSTVSDKGIKLLSNVSVPELFAVKEGLCFVQDEASQLCADAVGAAAGDTVIDTCACPGGKSFSMAMNMENMGKLYSFDLHESKLSLIEKSAKKLGIEILDIAQRDAREPDIKLYNKADRVLCDVPCSGLGVMAKKPDLRKKKEEDVAHLPSIQYDILCASSKYVKPNGILVYSTCTLNPYENEKITDRFVSENKEYAYSDFGKKTIFPYENGSDGFFIAKFVRV